MKHAKRILMILLICILTISAVFISYIGIENGAVVFAEDVHFMTDQELETAYQAYLQSKGGGLIGNAGARYAYTTGKMLNFITSDANTTGITTIDELKSQMTWQKQYLENGNGYLSLGITNRGMGLLNLYTQYLMQQHFFGNGVAENEDEMFNDDIDNELYSGQLFTDKDGFSCFVTVSNNTSITKLGTPYRYDTDTIVSLTDNNNNHYTQDFHLTDRTTYTFNSYKLSSYISGNFTYNIDYRSTSSSSTGSLYRRHYYRTSNQNDVYDVYGYPIIMLDTSTGNYYVGSYRKTIHGSNITEYSYSDLRIDFGSNNEQIADTNIYFYTNNNNNVSVYPSIVDPDANLYITPKVNVGLDGEVNYQPYIINEGDNITNIVNNYYTDSGTRDKTITVPSDDPAGGGSSDSPTGGNPPNWTNPFPHLSPDGEGGFNFNFQLPDLNIDWNISGLTEKFPFSIPFDFVAFCRVLDAEPETPALECDIDLKLVTWHVDYDLHQFDGIASLLRNLEFIAFCIALVIMTRNMIKG